MPDKISVENLEDEMEDESRLRFTGCFISCRELWDINIVVTVAQHDIENCYRNAKYFCAKELWFEIVVYLNLLFNTDVQQHIIQAIIMIIFVKVVIMIVPVFV